MSARNRALNVTCESKPVCSSRQAGACPTVTITKALVRPMANGLALLFPTAYRLRKSGSRTRHRLGGVIEKPAPKCGGCGAGLLLFADLDATDPVLAGDHPFQRLPLYYCCSCPGPVFYQVAPNGTASPFAVESDGGEEAPFEEPPKSLAKSFLTLEEIPPATLEIVEIARRRDGLETLNKSQRVLLRALLGRRPDAPCDVTFSQIGDCTFSYQGLEELRDVRCPNKECPNRRRTRPESRYRPLAVLDVWNDPFWDIKPLDAVEIGFGVCPGCFCIRSKYGCT